MFGSRSVAVLAGAALLVGASSFGAVAGDLVTSRDIKDDTVASRDIANNTIRLVDINDRAEAALAGKDGADGNDGVDGKDGVEGAPGKDGKDGKDGVTNLIAGAGYTQTWKGDGGAELQTSREECPAGQYALGGGYSTWGGDKDLGGDNKNIQVTVSAPYFEGEYIPVDEAGNFRPTEWVVKGYNNGTTDQIVRAWVVCATVAK
jgi:hypothetical protein